MGRLVTLSIAARLGGWGGRAAGSGLSAQFIRYAFVGIAQNTAAFALYLGLTAYGSGHKTAMTLVFVAATCATFYLNRSWSFRSRASCGPALLKYFALYGLAYALNWLGIWLLVDKFGYPHEWVQLALIFATAVFLFVSLRIWVFR